MIHISQAKTHDLFGIRKLEQSVLKSKDPSKRYENRLFTDFAYVFVAKEKNKVVGAILAMKTAKDEMYVENILIAPKFQHQGLEKRLYETLFAECGNLPILALVHTDNEASIKLHKQLGFKGVKKIADPFGTQEKTSSFLMRKEKQTL